MEDEEVTPTLPTLNEHDVAALMAILIRTIRAQDENARDHEVIKAANARIAANMKVRTSARGALAVFGFEAPEGTNIWHLVRKALGDEVYDRAVAIARGADFPALLTKMGDDQPPTETVEEGVRVADSVKATVVRRSVPIRTAILEYLRSLGDEGARVAQVKQHLVDAHGITVHDKTPGMTLYRLLKDGLVKREGRVWFATPGVEKKENEAPTESTEDASDPALAAQ